jgi:hypothetical protein
MISLSLPYVHPAAALLILLAAIASPGIAQDNPLIPDLLGSLRQFDRGGRDPAHKLGFEIPEKLLNQYLAYALAKRPRPGIASLEVALRPNNEFTALAGIDFEAVAGWDPELVPESLRTVLRGRRVLHMNGRFEVKNSAVAIHWKEVLAPDGKPIPQKVVAALLRSIGRRQNEALDLSRPIPLPGLKRLWTEKQVLCGET